MAQTQQIFGKSRFVCSYSSMGMQSLFKQKKNTLLENFIKNKTSTVPCFHLYNISLRILLT